MCPSRVYSIRTMTNVATREQFRVFLESYKNEVSQRFVGCGRKRIILLGHETSYGVGIENKTNHKCLAEVVIGDVILGVFVLFPRETIIIKRGTKDDKSLVFISNTSDIATQIGCPPVSGSGEIYVSLRPQLIPAGEFPSMLPFPRGSSVNKYGTALATNPTIHGMKVVSDGPISKTRSAGGAFNNSVVADCVDGGSRTCGGEMFSGIRCGEDIRSRTCGGEMFSGIRCDEDIRSAGVTTVKKSNENVDGSTVLGMPTGQRFQQSSIFPTLGCHNFRFLLQVGDSSRNVIYNGFQDDDGSPISRFFPYSVLV